MGCSEYNACVTGILENFLGSELSHHQCKHTEVQPEDRKLVNSVCRQCCNSAADCGLTFLKDNDEAAMKMNGAWFGNMLN